MKVLVTGGAGYIGSVLVDRLITGGHQVNVIDDLSNGFLENIHKDAKFFQGSILDSDLLNKALDQTEVVLHLGAKIRVEEGESKPELYKQVNIEGTLNLLKPVPYTQLTLPTNREVEVSGVVLYFEKKNEHQGSLCSRL